MKVRKKPIVVDASRWITFGDHPAVKRSVFSRDGGCSCPKCGESVGDHGWIKTLEGGHVVCPGDWIITGIQGEFYPCKPDIFLATYEKMEE